MLLKDLDKEIASKTGLSKSTVRKVLMHTEQTMCEKILFGQEIYLHQIGKFELRITKARERFNVSTGKYEDIAATYRLHFKVSRKLAEQLRQKTVYDGSYKPKKEI